MNVAVAQFPISSDISQNRDRYLQQIAEAKGQGADLVVFSEASLSGYGGDEWHDWRAIDMTALAAAEKAVRQCLADHEIWGTIGTAEFADGDKRRKPLNATLTVDPRGRVRTLYGKVFCTPGDLDHYTAGSTFPAVTIDGVRTGSLICFDFRFPELYRTYLRKNVRLMIHPFYQVGAPPYKTGLSHIGPIHIKSRAAENCMYVIAPNCGNKNSAWGSMIVNPDGEVILQLPRARAGVRTVSIDITPFTRGWTEVRRQNARRAMLGRQPLTSREAQRVHQ